MKKEIIKFLEENKVELFDKLVELKLVYIDDVEDGYLSVDDLMFVKGAYEKGDEVIESEEICGILEGMDSVGISSNNSVNIESTSEIGIASKLVELKLVYIDDVEDGYLSVDDLMFVKGAYEKGDEVIESEVS